MSIGIAYSSVGILVGAALHHAYGSLSLWWRPTPTNFPVCAGVETLAAEVRGLRETAFSTQLATGVAVGGVVASVLLAIWIAERVWAPTVPRSALRPLPSSPQRPAPTQHFALSPRALAAPLTDLDLQLDALEADPAALASYVPRRQ